MYGHAEACNFDAEATLSNPQDCDYAIDLYPTGFYNCDGECNNPSDYVYLEGTSMAGDTICQEQVVFGCTDMMAVNFNFFANVDDGSCVYGGSWLFAPMGLQLRSRCDCLPPRIL